MLRAFAIVLAAGLVVAGASAFQTPPPEKTDAKPAAPEPGAAKPAPAPAPAKQEPKPEAKPADPYVLNHIMKLIDGTDKNLKDYEGKVVLIVNVASKCGYTPQYKALEALHREYKDSGLVVLGFPANDFGHQEPGSDAEVLKFCSTTYDVTFQLFSKVSVSGETATPLFAQLAKLPNGGAPGWNFNKYLVGKDGKLVAHYESRVRPDDPQFRKAVRKALGLKEEAKDEPEAAK